MTNPMLPRLLAALVACLSLAACGTPWGTPRQVPPVAVPSVAAPPEVQGQARTFVEVLARVEPVAEAECRRRNPGADCDFRIVVDDRRGMPPNAFQTLDSRGRPLLAFTTSLIAQVANPDEMAFIMAHEASHHIAGHLARQDQIASTAAEAFGQIASREAGATPESIRQARLIGAQVGARTFSKEFELEADRLGAIVAAQAGFDPVRGAEFFLRIPDPGNRLFGTHPSNAERIAAVRGAVAGF